MCIPRRLEECSYGSVFTYNQKEWVVDDDKNQDRLVDTEDPFVKVVRKEDGYTQYLPCGLEVVSHVITPVESRKFQRCPLWAPLPVPVDPLKELWNTGTLNI